MPSKPSPRGDRRAVRIGKYEVLARLSPGDGPAVYRAKDAATGKEVFLHILPPSLVAQPGAWDRLRREADKVRRLRHENLLALLELGDDHGTYFLAREYAAGSDLAAYVKAHGKRGPAEAGRLVAQAARALGQAHEHGILHGRLHPGSFLITTARGRPAVKIADLGPALDGAGGEEARRPVEYLAPEQIRDRTPADARTDLYGLGCALYHLLAGRPPFPEGAPVEQRLQREPPDVRTLNADVPPALAGVLRKLLGRKLEDRYDGVPELLEELDKVAPPEEPAADAAGPATVPEGEDPLAALAALDGGLPADDQEGSKAAAARAPRLRTPARQEEADVPDNGGATKAGGAEAPNEKPARRVPKGLVIGGAIAGGVVLLGVIIAIGSQMSGGEPTTHRRPDNGPAVANVPAGPDNHDTASPGAGPAASASPQATGGEKPAAGGPVVQEPPKPSWPALYTPKKPLNLTRVLKEFEGPWGEGTGFPTDEAPILYVNRLGGAALAPPAANRIESKGAAGAAPKDEGKPARPAGKEAKGKDEKGAAKEGTEAPKGKGEVRPDSDETKAEVKKPDGWFNSLAAACAAIPEGQPTIIQIADNGPLFEPSIPLGGRRVLIQAAPGFHPLIVWEAPLAPAKAAGPLAFFSVTKGQLLLGQVDIGVKWPDPPAESVALVRATDSDFITWGCSFSVESRHKDGIAVVRLDGTASGKRCRLSRCLARGDGLAALDVRAPAAEVLVDDSLLAGGAPPLLRVEGRRDATPTLRVVRSTLVAGQTLLQVRAPGADGSAPALHWMGWDSLLARAGTEEGGTLVDLPAAATTEAMEWQAVNCLYAGWKTLLSGHRPIDVTDLDAWHDRWHLAEGDAAIPNPWAAVVRNDPAEEPPDIYGLVRTPMAYRASAGEGLIGCNLAALPPVTDTWVLRTYDRFVVPSVEVLADDKPPTIPRAPDGKYYGERLDLDKVDLGEYLRAVQKNQPLGRRVVLHLHGTGERKTSPIRVAGSSLVLYFEPPTDPGKRLVLVPDLKSDPLKEKPPQYGVIQVEAGNLELINADIRCPDSKLALLPHYVLAVYAGNLRIHHSRLQGPVAHLPDLYWGLIHVEGSGLWQTAWVRGLTVNDSVLVTGRMGLHVYGFGWRGRVLNSVLLSSGDAIHFVPTPMAPYRLNTQLTMERTTVAARRAVVYLEDVSPQLPLVVEPIVVQTKGCAFENPFPGPEGKGPADAGMLLYTWGAVPRGLLCWQGDDDAYDKRLRFYAVRADTAGNLPPLAAAQPWGVWQRLWGPAGDRGPRLDLPFKGTLDLDALALDKLEVSGRGVSAGANLGQLGIKKK